MNRYFTEADCFSVYRTIREGVIDDENEVGQGYNLFPCSSALIQLLHSYIESSYKNRRIENYSHSSDKLMEDLARDLIFIRFGLKTNDGTRVYFTNSGTEAISTILSAVGSASGGVYIPQPTYYAYEQSCLRSGATLLGRYSRTNLDNTMSDLELLPRVNAVVENFPSALDGACFTPSSLGCSKQIFRILDCVFQIPSARSEDIFEAKLKKKAAQLDLENSCLILTPSKDLSVPAFRCGMIVTNSDWLKTFLEKDRYERSFSVSFLIPQICILYMLVTVLFGYTKGKFAGNVSSLNRGIRRIIYKYPDFFCSMDWSLIVDLIGHLDRMRVHCQSGVDRLRDNPLLVDHTDLDLYEAGFSVFPRINIRAIDHKEFCQYINQLGRHTGIKLNPTVIFGGTFSSWDKLFPKEYRIRINVSGDNDVLESRLGDISSFFSKLNKLY